MDSGMLVHPGLISPDWYAGEGRRQVKPGEIWVRHDPCIEFATKPANHHSERVDQHTADVMRGHAYATREQPMLRTTPVFPDRWSQPARHVLRRLIPSRLRVVAAMRGNAAG